MDRQRIIEKLATTEFTVGGQAYAVVRELGRGGNGVAFLCRASTGEELVSKVYIPPDSRDLDEKAFKRFENEITLTGRLKHTNIVPTLGSSYVSVGSYKLPFYLMPVAVGTLRAEMRIDTDPQQIERKFRLFLRAAYGVACLHSHGIYHRDIKPENILISKNGTPWVADLGIAHVNSDFVTVSVRTADDERLLNRDYYAPEQRFGPTSLVDQRADIYALGCILYELLTAIPPVRANAPKLGALSPALKPIEPIWERMTAWQASDRYQHIEEALEDLSVGFGLVLATLHGVAGLEHPDVAMMSKLLRSNSSEHRRQGLELALRLGKVALPTLHSLVGHSKREVRNWCAKAMGGICDPDSLRYLVAGLYNEKNSRRRFAPFVDSAAEAIQRYPPEEKLLALQSVTRPIELASLVIIASNLKLSAAYDAILNLQAKELLYRDYGYTLLNVLVGVDEARAWPKVEKITKEDIYRAEIFIPTLGKEHQKTLLTEWANRVPDKPWRFKPLIKAVAESKLDAETKSKLFDIVERNAKAFTGSVEDVDARDVALTFLETMRPDKTDVGE